MADRQQTEVTAFFDHISGTYKSRYDTHDAFHHYFFNERLEKASQGLDLAGKTILDIGSGTGNLYDYLTGHFSPGPFYATDLSSGMLSQSRVPENQRFVGHAYDVKLPLSQFDFIYMLGVTTYLTAEDLEANLSFMHRALGDTGKALVTFTNRSSLDHQSRAFLNGPMRLLGIKSRVLSQPFSRYAYSLKEVEKLLESRFEIEEVRYLNHTVFPFNLLLKGLSLKMAKWIDRKFTSRTWLSLFSSDLLVIFRRKQ